MDPISAIGLVSAVAGLADVISRSISSLLELKSRYCSVGLKIDLLVGQLSTLKTALSQIAEINARLSQVPQHEQLVQDLATSLGCCEILILDLDHKLCSFQRVDSSGLDALGRVRFLQVETAINDSLNRLNNQISALNFLLMALQCRSILEQGTLLESNKTQQLFAKVRDDTSSLLWLRDPGSCNTQQSIEIEDIGSLDLAFDFDRDLCSSQVYRTATRSNMKIAILDGRKDKDKFTTLFPYNVNGPYDQAGVNDNESELLTIRAESGQSSPALVMHERDVSPRIPGTTTNCLMLKIVVVRARNLASKNRSGTSNPYFVLTLGGTRTSTHCVLTTLNPEWNVTCNMPISGINHLLLECACWHKNRFGNDYLGEFDIALEDIFANDNTEQPAKWYLLRSRETSGNKSSNVTGEVQLQFSLYDSSTPGATSQQVMKKFWRIVGAEPESITPKKTDNAMRRAGVTRTEDDDDDDLDDEEESSGETEDLSKPETVANRRRRMKIPVLMKSEQRHQFYEFGESSDVVGVVLLEIGKITDLPPEKNLTRTSFDMDSFVVASLGKRTYRTRVIQHNLNPIFSEKMIFKVLRHELAYSISFSVIDCSKLSGNESVASASAPLCDITSTAPKIDPKTGLYDLRDPLDCDTLLRKSDTRSKIPLAQSSYHNLGEQARPGLSTRNSSSVSQQTTSENFAQLTLVTNASTQTGDQNLLRSPGDHSEGSNDRGDPELHCFCIPLELKNKAKWEGKHSPELFIRAKYLPYPALRQHFWKAMLKMYDTDESGNISKAGLSTMLDTLGSTLKESTIDSFFLRFLEHGDGEYSWKMSVNEAVICLEDQLHVESKQSRAEKVKDTLPNSTIVENLIPSLSASTKAEGSSSSPSLTPISSSTLSKTAAILANEQSSINIETQNFDYFDAAWEAVDYLNLDDPDNRSWECHVAEIRECPICHQPRLDGRSDPDIIIHIATCTSRDWRQPNNIMASFVSPSQAQRKWYSKAITKLSYGNYRLGANSANILVQDRITGLIFEEHMSPYDRLRTRLLYKGLKSKDMEKKRIRKLLRGLSFQQGVKCDDPESKALIQDFINLHQLDMSEVLLPLEAFKCFNEFFYRQLKPNARPCSAPDNPKIIVSPADCRSVVFNRIDEATKIWVKGREFSMERLLGNAYPDNAHKYKNGALGIFRLAAMDYHRFHIPVDGVMGIPKYIEGEYYSTNPMAIRSALDVYGENIRVILPIDSVAHGRVMVICVGSMIVGSVVITRRAGEHVTRVEELGYFKNGGSTILLLFEEGSMRFDDDLVDNSSGALETLLRVGMSIGHHPRQT